MNTVGKAILAFFGGFGVLMVLVGRELEDRGGEIGAAASVFTLIGMIWAAAAIVVMVVLLLAGRAATRQAVHEAELVREASQRPDVTPT